MDKSSLKLLCSFDNLVNILPYFGYLNEGYKLLNYLHPKTREAWKQYNDEIIQKMFKNHRSTLKFIYNPRQRPVSKAEYLLYTLKQDEFLLKIYDMPDFHLMKFYHIDYYKALDESVGREYIKFNSISFENMMIGFKFKILYYYDTPATVEPFDHSFSDSGAATPGETGEEQEKSKLKAGKFDIKNQKDIVKDFLGTLKSYEKDNLAHFEHFQFDAVDAQDFVDIQEALMEVLDV